MGKIVLLRVSYLDTVHFYKPLRDSQWLVKMYSI